MDVEEEPWRRDLVGLGQPGGGDEMFGLVVVQGPEWVGGVSPYVTGHAG